MSQGPQDDRNPRAPAVRAAVADETLVDSLLGSSLQSAQAKDLRLQHHVAEALHTLDDLKQEVVKRRFGFDGQLAQDYEQIAAVLTVALSPELRVEMAQDRGILASDVSISAQDVKHIETLALRSLRKPRQQL